MKIQQIRELVNIPYRKFMVSFTGRVVSGQQLGRKIGFPTANLSVQEKLELPLGVYGMPYGSGLPKAKIFWGRKG